MTSASDASTDGDDGPSWSLLGLGGALSRCCLFGSAAAGATGATAAGGATASVGGGLVQVAVSVLTVGVLGATFYAFRS